MVTAGNGLQYGFHIMENMKFFTVLILSLNF